MDPSLYEAALDLGATPGYTLIHIIIPQIASGIISGFDAHNAVLILVCEPFVALTTYVLIVSNVAGFV